MTRKTIPISELNVPSLKPPTEKSVSARRSLMNTNASAPTNAPSMRRRPPMTAMMSTLIVAPRPIVCGSTWPFHHTNSTPAIDAMNAPNVNASVRCSATL